jgi:hypothetical protein
MRMRILLFLAIGLAALGAHAQPGSEPAVTPAVPRADFLALDKNRDGYLSKLEAAGDREISKRFAAFDMDRDGRLSESEYAMAKDDNDRRIVRDAALTARVKAALLAASGIPSLSIAVDTYEGRVQLSGFVTSPDIVSRAGRVTAGVSGVRTVNNNISVK